MKFGGANSCLWKLIFCLVELIFSYFSDSPSGESYFPSGVNVFWNESSNPYGGDAFSVPWKPFSLIWSFFLQVETVTEISGNQQKGIFCLVKTVFFYFVLLSCKSKQLLKLVDTSTFKSVFSIKWPFLMSKYKKQFCRVLKITVKELTWFTFSHLFGHNFTFKTTLTVYSSKVQN